MDVEIKWHKPIALTSKKGRYCYKGISGLAMDGPGIYFFARRYGKKVVPLYIGRTTHQTLKKRLDQHLDRVSFVKKLEEALNGGLIYVFGTLVPKKGVKQDVALKLIETALIQEVLAENKELFNEKGAKRPHHTVSFTGNQVAKTATERKSMRIRKD